MRVALDEQIFTTQYYGGISRLFAELSKHYLAHPEFGVDLAPISAPVVNRYLLDDPALRSSLKVEEAHNSITALARYFSRTRPRTVVDVVHNTFYLPHGLAGYPGAKRVVTIHDMIPELMPHTRRRLDFLTMKKRYVMDADHIICVSEATRKDLIQVYGPMKAPVSVIHHGVDQRFKPGVPKIDSLPDEYILFVGNRGQYKNAEVLFRAFAQLSRKSEGIELLCVGGTRLGTDEIALLSELDIRGRVTQLILSDLEMTSAYANARFFVFPSRFEGFGLPALEAMASGVPVVLARASALPEVGGDAALYFAPGNSEELHDVMVQILHDEKIRRELVASGLSRAREFTWTASARSTAAVYESLMG